MPETLTTTVITDTSGLRYALGPDDDWHVDGPFLVINQPHARVTILLPLTAVLRIWTETKSVLTAVDGDAQ